VFVSVLLSVLVVVLVSVSVSVLFEWLLSVSVLVSVLLSVVVLLLPELSVLDVEPLFDELLPPLAVLSPLVVVPPEPSPSPSPPPVGGSSSMTSAPGDGCDEWKPANDGPVQMQARHSTNAPSQRVLLTTLLLFLCAK
jgi:hypothetical protein